jgi:hypothetical protein
LDLLVEALRPTPSPMDLDCVVGVRGPIAPPETCNELMVPIVVFDQIYSFDRDALIKAIPPPKGTAAEHFGPAAEELFDRIMQMADNAGSTDEHRALNYLAVRYQAIYANAAEAFARDAALTKVEVAPSPLSGTRNVVDVIFSYTNRKTDVMEIRVTHLASLSGTAIPSPDYRSKPTAWAMPVLKAATALTAFGFAFRLTVFDCCCHSKFFQDANMIGPFFNDWCLTGT